MISFDKLRSVDRSTSMIRRTITSKNEITGRETLLTVKSRERVLIVSLCNNQCKTSFGKGGWGWGKRGMCEIAQFCAVDSGVGAAFETKIVSDAIYLLLPCCAKRMDKQCLHRSQQT
jgi:hypothetical protein